MYENLPAPLTAGIVREYAVVPPRGSAAPLVGALGTRPEDPVGPQALKFSPYGRTLVALNEPLHVDKNPRAPGVCEACLTNRLLNGAGAAGEQASASAASALKSRRISSKAPW